MLKSCVGFRSILSKVQLMDRTTATRLAGEVDDWNTHA